MKALMALLALSVTSTIGVSFPKSLKAIVNYNGKYGNVTARWQGFKQFFLAFAYEIFQCHAIMATPNFAADPLDLSYD